MIINNDLERWMQLALAEAKKAQCAREVPVGAVAVWQDEVVTKAHNLREATQNPLGHAEILLLQKLRSKQARWRYTDVTVVVTLEPCVMCMGALLQARIPRLVFGCRDPKAGACGSVYDLVGDRKLPHRMEVVEGVLEGECSERLQQFFQKLRRS